MADWSILQPTPNFAAAALTGYQAGQQVAKQRRLDDAMANIDLERPETLLPLLRADPATGAALIGASSKLADAKRESESRAALGTYLGALQPGQAPHPGAVTALMPSAPPIGASGVPAVPASGDNPGTPAQAPTDPNEITVTAQKPQTVHQPDALEAARQHLIQIDPDKYLEIQDNLSKMSEAQRKQTDDATSAFAAVGQAASRLPYDQRKAYIQSQSGYLAQHNVNADQIASFDPNDQNLFAVVSQSLGVKGILEQQNKDRDFNLSQSRFGEDVRHNKVSEGNAAANLGVAQGHLALDRTKEAREAATGNGNHAPTRNIGGQTYYMVGGKWYDNPEGK